MSLTISNYYAGLAASPARNAILGDGTANNTAAGAGYRAAQDAEGGDTVQLSSAGRLAASALDSLILPTADNVHRLSAQLSQDLGDLFANAGISTQPPVEFSTGPSGEIQVQGDRADKDEILAAVNGNGQIQEEIRTTAAISSQAAGMGDSLKFSQEYLASNNPESVVAKYSYLFNSSNRSHDISLRFDGNGIDVMEDGTQWLSSGA